MKRKLTFFISVITALGFLFSSCKTTASSVEREAGKEYRLTVLHVNDTHGAVLPNGKGQGGLAYLAGFIKSEKAKAENALVLHAGDMNTGSALSNMFHAEPDIAAFNEMGLDCAALGNHEFDGSLEKLKKQIALSKFTWLSANIKQGSRTFAKPYAIKNYEGFRVAVIGVTTNRTKTIASPDKSLTFLNEIEAVRTTVQQVRAVEKADIVIVLGHLGLVEETEGQVTSKKLAENVSGIDLIVDGHSHTYMEKPEIVNGVPIVSANEQGKYAGEGVLHIVDGKVIGFDWKAVPIDANTREADAAVETILQPYVEKANAALKETVMKTTAAFEFGKRLTRYQEMPLGDFVCDALCAYIRSNGLTVDGAFTNGGGIRAELPKGNVTREDILTMLPFENYVYVVTLRGDDVEKLFTFIAGIKQGAGAFAQVSKEIRYTITYDKSGNGSLSGLTINGQPVDKNRTYKFATNDYVARGGDGYEVLKNAIDTYNTSMLLSTVVMDYAKSLGSGAITPMSDGRITVIGGSLENAD